MFSLQPTTRFDAVQRTRVALRVRGKVEKESEFLKYDPRFRVGKWLSANVRGRSFVQICERETHATNP